MKVPPSRTEFKFDMSRPDPSANKPNEQGGHNDHPVRQPFDQDRAQGCAAGNNIAPATEIGSEQLAKARRRIALTAYPVSKARDICRTLRFVTAFRM